jgi:uncharacterized repeat protein (TIGR01451 family)
MLKCPRLIAAVALCTAALITQTTFASNLPTFGPPDTVSTATPAVNMVMGDFDGDGIPDVAIMGASYNSSGIAIGGSVEVYFGDGSNGFRSASAPIPLSLAGSAYTAIAAGNVSGDSQSQLIIAGTNIVVIYNWNGINFSETKVIDLTATGITATYVVVGDLTKHGSQDILVTDQYSPVNGSLGLVWIPNDGEGNFQAPTNFPTWGNSTRPVLTDVNGDGLVDVVLDSPNSSQGGIGTNYSEGGTTVGVLTNNGDGTLSAEVLWGAQTLYGKTNSSGRFESLNTVGVAVADVNGDGNADLISACFVYDGAPDFKYTYYLSVNLGNGDGTFQDGEAFRVTNGIVRLDAADINGNGLVDFVTIDDPLVDQAGPGFTVTEISGVGTNLDEASQTDFTNALVNNGYLSYSSLVLGYKSTNGTFVTFNNDPRVDVILGSGQNIYGADNTVHHQFLVFQNTTGTTLAPMSVDVFAPLSPGAPMGFLVSQSSTVAGLIVRIQYTMTPTIQASWTNLPDGNGGILTRSSTDPGVFTSAINGTTFYPAGTAVYFRAIATAPGYAESISTNALKSYTLEQGKFTINVRETSTSDPTGALHAVHIGDELNFTFIWTNIGNATAHDVVVSTYVPTYQDAATDLHNQFPSNTLTYAAWGHYVRETAPGADDAYVWWRESDLPPGSSQAVTLSALIGPSVRLNQEIAVLDDYTVQSTNNEPPTLATGTSSGSPNEYSTVLGPLSLTITPDVTTVAPGGIINYTIRITNLASYTARNVVIADPAPEFTHFAGATFVNAKGAPIGSPSFKVEVGKKSMTVSNPLRLVGLYPSNSLPAAVQTFLANNPEIVAPSDFADQAVFYVGNLAKGGSAAVRFTVQAEYIDPVDVPDQEIKNFDYLAYFEDPSGNIVESENQSGLIFTPVAGTVQNAPNLVMVKFAPQNLVPGQSFMVGFCAKNTGSTAADDVFIQDLLPVGGDSAVNPVLLAGAEWSRKGPLVGTSVFINGSSQPELNSTVAFLSSSARSMVQDKANYFVTLDPGGTITMHGLHLEPNELIGIFYSMMMPANTPVPESLVAGASFIGAGNGDRGTNGTGTNQFIVTVPGGMPQETQMTVNGDIQLFTPNHPAPAVISQMVSPDPGATAAQLDALYKKNTNASLIVPKSNPPTSIPGVQRYILHYQNTGTDIANDVHLLFPTPTNTAFYRALFVSGTNFVQPNIKLGQGIIEPLKLNSGDVIFNLGNLSGGSGGYVMVEVIILPTAINPTKSQIVASPLLYTTNVPPLPAVRKLDDGSSDSGGTIVYDGQNVPQVGVVKIVPQAVQEGGIFAIQCAMFNYGGVGGNEVAQVTVQAPAGTEIVGLTGTALVISSNSTMLSLSLAAPEHYASGFSVLLTNMGGAGTKIAENSIVVNVPYCGTFTPAPTSIPVVSAQQAVPSTTITTVLGAQFVTLGEMVVIPLGQYQPGVGSALVCGPTGLFGDLQSASVLSDSWGTTLVVGPARDIPLLNLPVVANLDTGAALARLKLIIGNHGGDIFNGPQSNLIAPDGESLIDNDSGLIGGTVKELLSAGVQSVIASGAGTLPAVGTAGPAAVSGGRASAGGGGHLLTAGGGVVSNDGGSVVSNDGGSLINQDGGGLINQDGGGVVSNDGGSVVSNDGGSLISGLASSASAQSTGGNIVSQGAGN